VNCSRHLQQRWRVLALTSSTLRALRRAKLPPAKALESQSNQSCDVCLQLCFLFGRQRFAPPDGAAAATPWLTACALQDANAALCDRR
jgi:hypothetical protein